MADAAPLILHASAVEMGGKGLLITGASGSGKSTLSLELIALGATLIADDRVCVTPKNDGLVLSAPEAIRGRIEARGLGLLALPCTTARAWATVTLDALETARLPEAHTTVIAGATLPLLRKLERPAFAAILAAYLTGERTDP